MYSHTFHKYRVNNELAWACLCGVLLISLCALFFSVSAIEINPLSWGLLALVFWLYVFWQAWRRIDLNRPSMAAPCFADFGWANRLTLLRGGLIALAGGFLFQVPIVQAHSGKAVWIPGLLYSTAALLDGVDGYVARRSGKVSLLGKELDTEMDALGLLVAPLLAVFFGKFHWSFLAVSAAYYVFIAGLRLRRHRDLPVYPLPPNVLRRILAGFQMGFVALALLPIFSSSVTRLLGVVFMVPILLGFLLDWLAVSGRVSKPDHLRGQLARLGNSVLQPLLRITVCLLVFYRLNIDGFDLLRIVFSLLALLVLLGLGARVTAGILLISWSFAQGSLPLTWQDAALLTAATGILLFGAGNFSLWRGDDAWLERH